MEIEKTDFDNLVIITPECFEDERGYFFESYNGKQFEKMGLPVNFVQDNQACSKKGVLRGLHFQNPPFAQGKLIRVVIGEVLNINVDLRKKSEKYGEYFSIILSDSNKKILWIPEGFANGYLALKNNTLYAYKCTNFYNKVSERGVIWNDGDLNINWKLKKYGIENPIISEKDKKLPFFKDIEKNLLF